MMLRTKRNSKTNNNIMILAMFSSLRSNLQIKIPFINQIKTFMTGNQML